MSNGYPEPIGSGGLWIRESKKGNKFLSWQMTFAWNNHPVTVSGVAFKNEQKQGKQPDYRMSVSDAKPAEPRPEKPKEMNEQWKEKAKEEELPF